MSDKQNLHLLSSLPDGIAWDLLELATEGVWRWDIKTDQVQWSPKLLSTLQTNYCGKTHMQVVDILAVTHPDDVDFHRNAIKQKLLASGDYNIKVRMLNKDGNYLPCIVRGTTLTDTNGEPEYALGFVLDNSNEFEAQRKVLEERKMFVSFMDKCPAAVYLKNEYGQHIYINDVGAKMVGLPKADIIGKTASEIFPKHVAEKLNQVDRQVFEQNEMFTWQGKLDQKAGGESLYLYDVKFPLEINKTTRLLGGYGFDITELQETKEAINAIQKMDSIGRLAGGIAHDFNNMLAIMLGHIELAKMDFTHTERVAKSIGKIEEVVERSANLVQQLLGFARKQAYASSQFDLNDAVHEALSMIRPLIKETITIDYTEFSQSLPVNLDKSQLTQVLTNLCINARDAIDALGTIRISTSLANISSLTESEYMDVEAGYYAVLEVSDTGSGISPEHIEQVFEPFYTTKPQGEGTGLGLSTAFGIAKQHGGDIKIDSAPNQGTTVRVFFPIHEVSPIAIEEDSKSEAKEPHHRKVLIVEDEEDLLEVLNDVLLSLGYSPLAASSPIKALTLYEQHANEIEALITDITMPEMSGYQLADKLKAKNPQLPTIFTTGHSDSINQKVQESPTCKVLIKPVTIRTLHETLQRVLNQ